MHHQWFGVGTVSFVPVLIVNRSWFVVLLAIDCVL